MKKKSFQLGIVASIALIKCMIYLPILIEVEIQILPNSATKICWAQSIPYWNVLNIFKLIESVLLPFLILMVTTAVTLRAIILSKRKLRFANKNSLVKRRCKRKHSNETMFAINSIVRNATFVLLRSPVIFSYYFDFTRTNQIYQYQSYFFQFTLILTYANNSIGFLVNVATNSIFRKELKKMIFKK
jgi:hypothetical protein